MWASSNQPIRDIVQPKASRAHHQERRNHTSGSSFSASAFLVPLIGIGVFAIIVASYWPTNTQVSPEAVKQPIAEPLPLSTEKEEDMQAPQSPDDIDEAEVQAVKQQIEAMIAQQDPPEAKPSTIEVTVKGQINIRAAASTSGKIIGKAKAGQRYEYTEKKEGWYRIAIPDHEEAWISADFVQEVNDP